MIYFILAISTLLYALAVCGSSPPTAFEYYAVGEKFDSGEGVERDSAKALSYYNKALELDELHFGALYNSAIIYHQQGEYARALTLFLRAAKSAKNMEPDANKYEAMARSGLGTAYQKLGKEEKAQKQFEIARRMNPLLIEAHYNYINILIMGEQYQKAEKALSLAEKLAPSEKYGKLKGILKGGESKRNVGGENAFFGLFAVIGFLLLYGLFLRRRAQQRR